MRRRRSLGFSAAKRTTACTLVGSSARRFRTNAPDRLARIRGGGGVGCSASTAPTLSSARENGDSRGWNLAVEREPRPAAANAVRAERYKSTMGTSRSIQTTLCTDQERCLSPVFVVVFFPPVGLLALGVWLQSLPLVAAALGLLAGDLGLGPSLMRNGFADRVDEMFARTTYVAGFPERRRRRIARLRRRWSLVSRTVGIVDLFLAVVLVRSTLAPTHVDSSVPIVAALVAVGILLVAVLGSLWVIMAWLELREDRQSPKVWFSEPLVRARASADLLDVDGVHWLRWFLGVVGVLLVVTGRVA